MKIREAFAAALRRLWGRGEKEPEKRKATPPGPLKVPAGAAGGAEALKPPPAPAPSAQPNRRSSPQKFQSAPDPGFPPDRRNSPVSFQSVTAEAAWPPARAGAGRTGLPGASWLGLPGDPARELSEALRFQRRMTGTAGEFGEEIL